MAGVPTVVSQIRSHSARHRRINGMKAKNAPHEVGKQMARIVGNEAYANYGRLTDEQSAASLQKNEQLQEVWARRPFRGMTGAIQQQVQLISHLQAHKLQLAAPVQLCCSLESWLSWGQAN